MAKAAAISLATGNGRGRTRERILEAAEAALAANGGDFEMSEISARAGASTGLAYHYFGSKSGLISAVIERFYDRYDAVVNARMDGRENWASRERRRLENLVAFLFADPLAPVVLARLSRSPEAHAVEAARQREMIALSAKNIESGQRAGEIKSAVDPEIAGAAIMGGIRQACAIALAKSEKPDRQKLCDDLWMFIAGAVQLQETRS